MVVVVLPTPPFWLHIAMIRAGPWEARAAGSGNSGSGRPVGPTCPAVRILNAASESNSLSPVPVLLTVSLALIGETLSAGTGVARAYTSRRRWTVTSV